MNEHHKRHLLMNIVKDIIKEGLTDRMNNKIIGLLLIIIAGCTMLTGCGASGNTRKLKSMAVKYVKEKYGFKAKANRVSNDGISWLTPIWEKSKAGIVEMKYEGKTFCVHADLNSGVDSCTDNYQEDEFCEKIAAPFQNIQSADKEIVVAYTEGQYKHLVGKNIKTFDDLIADERIPGIFVYIYTYGLDTDSVSSMDMSDKPWISTVSVYDWQDPSMLHSDYKPVTAPYTEELILKSYAEYSADPSKFSLSLENGEKGRFVIKRYKQIEYGDLYITCGDTDDLVVSDYPGSPDSDHRGTTAWYQITNNGKAAKGNILFSGELADHDKKLGYFERYDGEKTYISLMGYNGDLHNFGDEYYSTRYTIEAGETIICRMMTEDK